MRQRFGSCSSGESRHAIALSAKFHKLNCREPVMHCVTRFDYDIIGSGWQLFALNQQRLRG